MISAENRPRAILAMVVSTIVGAYVLMSGIGEIFRGLSYDLPYAFMRKSTQNEVVVLKMDDAAYHDLRQDPGRRWSRALHAKLLDHLKAAGASMVVFDVFLADAGVSNEEKQEDVEFIEAMKRFGNVVLAAVRRPHSRPDYVLPSFMKGDEPIPPADVFLEAVSNRWGIAAAYKEKDRDVIRRHCPENKKYPSLAWRAAELFGAKLRPGDRLNSRWLRYYGPYGTIAGMSYSDYEKVDFKGKVVFVGGEPATQLTGGRADEFNTPFTFWTGEHFAGVELVATTFLNLMKDDWLTEISPIGALIMVLLTGPFFGYLLSLFRPAPGAGVAVLSILVVAACGILSFWLFRYFFDWALVAGVQIPAAYAVSAIGYSKKLQQEAEFLTREKQRIEKELETLRSKEHTPLPAAPPLAPLAGIEGGPQVNKDLEIRDFELLRPIGEGAYGEVWLARSLTGAYRAIKIIHRNRFSEQRPFEREFEGVRTFEPISLTNPGWVAVLHVGKDDSRGFFYYVMEAADDMASGSKIDPNNYTPKTLGKMLVEKPWLPVVDCAGIGIQLADALAALHKLGLVHRDVKPSNVIFAKGHAKLADIGLVATTEGPKSFAGTEGFIPPEGPGTPLADIFSLGRTLYQAATGCDPKRQPGLPTALGERTDQREFMRLMDIINIACASSPGRRYQSAEDLRKDLVKLDASLNGRRKAL